MSQSDHPSAEPAGNLDQLLGKLWDDYAAINPQAEAIRQLLTERGETVVNDHIALRTFGDPRIGIEVLAQPFVQLGYHSVGEYDFAEKKLTARHFEHDQPGRPLVFISELKLGECTEQLRGIVGELIDAMPAALPSRWDFPVCGRPWPLEYSTYERLGSESEYAAWLAAFGFGANHFTVLINALKGFDDLAAFNDFIEQAGYRLNDSGGKIKGSPEVYLEQSSTLAAEVEVDFLDGRHWIPGCYYEFALRYPLPDGKLFKGFVAQSADKIFESTDRR